MFNNSRFHRTDVYQKDQEIADYDTGFADYQANYIDKDHSSSLYPEIPFFGRDTCGQGTQAGYHSLCDASLHKQRSPIGNLLANIGCHGIGACVERLPLPALIGGVVLFLALTAYAVSAVLSPSDNMSVNGVSVMHATDQGSLRPDDNTQAKRDSLRRPDQPLQEKSTTSPKEQDASDAEQSSLSTRSSQEIVVHVVGQVVRPGVYKIPEGSRINDALEAAGGLSAEADISLVNLAQVIHDGERIKIPYAGEELSEADREILNQAYQTTQDGSQGSLRATSSPGQGSTQNKVNINTANKEQLCSIPGVGDKTADSILEYRQKHGRFNRIEDIEQVSGIGPKKFEKMKSYLAVS